MRQSTDEVFETLPVLRYEKKWTDGPCPGTRGLVRMRATPTTVRARKSVDGETGPLENNSGAFDGVVHAAVVKAAPSITVSDGFLCIAAFPGKKII